MSTSVYNLCKDVASGIGALKRIRPFVNDFSRLVQPYFDYCSVVWDARGTTLAGKIQNLQNLADRVLTSANYDVKCRYSIRKTWMERSPISTKNCQRYLGAYSRLPCADVY